MVGYGGECKECSCKEYTSSTLRGKCEGKKKDGGTCGHRQNDHS